jgi:hypothetical protein
MRQAWVLVVLGCGRLGFDQQQARDVDAGGSNGANADAKVGAEPTTDAGVDAALDPSLVAWWRMEALTPSSNPVGDVGVADSTGMSPMAQCGGQLPCPTIVAGKLGNAAQFDGSTTMLEAKSVAALIDSSFTIAAWVNLEAANGGCIMTKGLGSGVYNSWALCNDMATQALFFYTAQTTAPNTLEPGNQVPLNSWHHVAGTWDGTSKVLYLDGNKLGDDQPPGIDFDSSDVFIGGDVDNGAATSFLNGTVDEVRVYNRSLSAGEIATLAQ